jgi:phosphotriesterase-related protein
VPVRTLSGDVDPATLGRCLAHVHLLGAPQENNDVPDLALRDRDRAAEEMVRLGQAGVGAVVEMGPWDFEEHELADLLELERASGVAFVAVAGARNGQIAAPQLREASVEELAERACREFAGETDDGIPVGALKAGTGVGEVSDLDRKLIAAIGLAHQRCGAPVLTHSEHGALAREQVEELERAGVDPGRVAIGHTDRAGSEVQLAVLGRGAYLVLDQIGKFKYLVADDYARLIATILDAGYEERLMLSSDFGRCSYLHAYGGSPGLDYLVREFVDEMIERGIPPAALEKMLVDNPARFLTHDGDGTGTNQG